MNRITKSALAAFAFGLILITASAFTSHVGLVASTVFTIFAGAFLYQQIRITESNQVSELTKRLEFLEDQQSRNYRLIVEVNETIIKLRSTVESVNAQVKFKS